MAIAADHFERASNLGHPGALGLYECVCMYMYVCTCKYECICMYAFAYVWVHVYVYAYVPAYFCSIDFQTR